MTPRHIVSTNGVDLCVQEFGDPTHPALLLISGAGTTMELWPSELCERLAGGGRRVVRYDLRDTGESTRSGPDGPTYTSGDLAADVVGLLDALDVRRAHIAGMSMGGGIAQVVALRHPERLHSLTLISTSPAGPAEPERELPGMSAQDEAAFMSLTPPDWGDLGSTLDYLVAGERLCAAKSVPFDEEPVRRSLRTAVERSPDPSAAENHYAILGAEVEVPPLRRLQMPTLVLHGDEDPLFALAHAEALVAEIPNARLHVLQRVGHEMPERVWGELVDALVTHTAGPPTTNPEGS